MAASAWTLAPLAAVAVLAAAACAPGDGAAEPDDDSAAAGDDDTAWRPDLVCPGDPSGVCDAGGGTALEVGAGQATLTPELWEAWTDANGNGAYSPTDGDSYFDCGTDRLCPARCDYTDGSSVDYGESPGYPGPDADGSECDQAFQAVWMAGFGNGRAMNGVHDELWARAIVLRQGETSLGLVAVDLIGYFYNEVEEIRARARQELGLDLVVVASTHAHEGPDTMGIWGRSLVESGLDPTYMEFVQERVHEALADAAATVAPARATFGHRRIEDDDAFGNGINNLNWDLRDPGITDPNVRAIRFSRLDSDETIATLVNWANHPEALSDDNLLVTSDFVDALREVVESGVETPDGFVAGLGGTAVYFNGALGGMMSPLAAPTSDLFAQATEDDSFAKSDAIGSFIGLYAIEALSAPDATVDDAPALSFRTTSFKLEVENVLYAIMFEAGVFDRPVYDYDPDRPLDEDNPGYILTEVDLLRIGAASVLTIPGELLPEWAVGGYDGSLTGPLAPFIDDEDHAPPIEQAPAPPYLFDLMPGEHPMVFGLANDELGYLIPPYNYVLHEANPYVLEADGDHYEETNSLGPAAAPAVIDTALRLMAWEP